MKHELEDIEVIETCIAIFSRMLLVRAQTEEGSLLMKETPEFMIFNQ